MQCSPPFFVQSSYQSDVRAFMFCTLILGRIALLFRVSVRLYSCRKCIPNHFRFFIVQVAFAVRNAVANCRIIRFREEFLSVIRVPISRLDTTSTSSINASITAKPIPDLSPSASVVKTAAVPAQYSQYRSRNP